MTRFEYLTGIVKHDSEQVRGSWSWMESGCARGPAAGRGVPVAWISRRWPNCDGRSRTWSRPDVGT